MNIQYTARLSKIESVLKEKLPSFITDSWKNAVFSSLPTAVTNEHIHKLVQPCQDLVLLGGKRWRPLLLVLCAELAANDNVELSYELTPMVELVHTASLIHDDIEDSADTRRGTPATHIKYGIDTAINAGSWLFLQGAESISMSNLSIELQNIVYETYFTELRRLHLGQSMDIEWHKRNYFIPSKNEYMAMVRLKTGTLASLSAQVGFLIGGGSKVEAETLGNIAADIGVGFQILDDVINLTTGNKGKKRGDDIVEGKKSLPVILHTENNPKDIELLGKYFRLAAEEGPESSAIEQCITLLNSSNAISTALEISKNMISTACNRLTELYKDKYATELVTELFSAMLL